MNGKENVVYTHNGGLFGYKEEYNSMSCRKMDVTGDYCVEEDTLSSERYILHGFALM
jgi:hypothetical protein